ncbi:MAG: 50S rRNA methyltransferase, partial [Parachlamydiaceae bacterium]
NRLFGIDINRARVMEAKGNIRNAGFQKFIQMEAHDLRTFKPSFKPTMMIANPPYGKRLEDEKTLVPLYRAIGDFFKSQAPAKGFVLTGSMPLSKEVGLKADKRNVITHGGLDARFLEFDIYK